MEKERKGFPRKKKNNKRKITDVRTISREELNAAIQEFLDNGGSISRIEPEWIEEGISYCFNYEYRAESRRVEKSPESDTI